MPKKNVNQKCTYLADWMYKACEASIKPYTPSQFQLAEYCKSGSHIKCPFYLDALDGLVIADSGNRNTLQKERRC
jgi:hypothetical protein